MATSKKEQPADVKAAKATPAPAATETTNAPAEQNNLVEEPAPAPAPAPEPPAPAEPAKPAKTAEVKPAEVKPAAPAKEKTVTFRALSDHECTIGGVSYTLVKGEDKELPKEIAAILSSHGVGYNRS